MNAIVRAKVTPAYAHSLSSAKPGNSSTIAATGLATPRIIRRYCGYPALVNPATTCSLPVRYDREPNSATDTSAVAPQYTIFRAISLLRCGRLNSQEFIGCSHIHSISGAERPAVGPPGPEQERYASQREHTDAERDHPQLRGGEHEYPPKYRDQCRDRI